MSLSDITLNSRVYSVTNVAGSRVLRANLADTGLYPGSLEISHTVGARNKPNRHLVRFADGVVIGTDPETQMSAHVVYTAPKGATATNFVNITEDLTDLLLTSGFIANLLAGGFGA